jgi:hypothetical protein
MERDLSVVVARLVLLLRRPESYKKFLRFVGWMRSGCWIYYKM